jgi:glutamate 5-kinase
LVASLVNADLLILLTDIDGLYTADPRTNPQAQLISVVEEIDEKITSLAGKTGSKFASGGMITKIEAGKIAVNAGIQWL